MLRRRVGRVVVGNHGFLIRAPVLGSRSHNASVVTLGVERGCGRVEGNPVFDHHDRRWFVPLLGLLNLVVVVQEDAGGPRVDGADGAIDPPWWRLLQVFVGDRCHLGRKIVPGDLSRKWRWLRASILCGLLGWRSFSPSRHQEDYDDDAVIEATDTTAIGIPDDEKI